LGLGQGLKSELELGLGLELGVRARVRLALEMSWLEDELTANPATDKLSFCTDSVNSSEAKEGVPAYPVMIIYFLHK